MKAKLSGVLLTAWLVAFANTALAETYTARVVGVADGDTITVLDENKRQHKIRLLGIDAPEKHQSFGQASKRNLSRAVFGQSVLIETEKRDRYQRELAKVWHDNLDINLEQVKSGLAWHYKQYARDQSAEDQIAYAEAEALARDQNLGLWADNDPVPPWVFRKLKR